jgi:2-iminoacetate synthase ThiH
MLSRPQLIELWESNDLIELGREADYIRKRLNPEGIVTYTRSTNESALEQEFRRTDTVEQRLSALDALNSRDGMVTFRPIVEPSATGMEYVKTVALCRICLDNVPHIQTTSAIFGLKVAQIALRFGADDLGSVEDGVSEEELRRVIRDAGFVPKQRDALFRTYSLA